MKLYFFKQGGGAEKVLAMLKGGHNTFWGSFNKRVLALLK